MENEKMWKQLWHLVVPELVYIGCCYLVQIIAGVAIMLQMIRENGYTVMENQYKMIELLSDQLIQNAMLLQTIGAVIAIPFLIRMFNKDLLRRRFYYEPVGRNLPDWFFAAVAGGLTAVSGNFLMNITDFAEHSEGFQQAEQMLFSGAVVFQLVGIGLILPVCEELVFRALVYMRLRQFVSVNTAILLSAAGFAIVHGNMVQGMYALIAGILFAYLYEQYGSLKAPMIAHISANLVSLLIGNMNFPVAGGMLYFLIGTVAAGGALLIIVLIDRKVKTRIAYVQ